MGSDDMRRESKDMRRRCARRTNRQQRLPVETERGRLTSCGVALLRGLKNKD